ncbi:MULTISPECIES: type II toxin-antitoxin system YafQ family toxin [Syntrophomonas]|jgi:mRNA interferase YafQ|uniref:type II toxin-antitoxin system YafQ family toxin n=1 Tax=Syntrophomonas TaxID=862 RepID=UPI0007743923|nr:MULTISPECIES: type II toxin-antitoxin system mRNA interferase toxin, RelE/StbE family [Syntrophomonas]MDD4627646.1 type II toxin-antitoxin system mRNA interferase toxin, RelE/StbE family [Syntrophomonas sp.]
MYIVKRTRKFDKDLKLLVKRGYNIDLLTEVVKKLANGDKLAEKYQDHALSGNWIKYRECHIIPDWLLIYRIDKDTIVLILTRTGTHSDLF